MHTYSDELLKKKKKKCTYTLLENAWSKWLQMCTYASASLCDPVSSSCPVSFESALRGLTWAATCLSLIRPNEAPPPQPPHYSTSVLFSLFVPHPPSHLHCTPLGALKHTCISVPLANHMHEEDNRTAEQFLWWQILLMCSDFGGTGWLKNILLKLLL